MPPLPVAPPECKQLRDESSGAEANASSITAHDWATPRVNNRFAARMVAAVDLHAVTSLVLRQPGENRLGFIVAAAKSGQGLRVQKMSF